MSSNEFNSTPSETRAPPVASDRVPAPNEFNPTPNAQVPPPTHHIHKSTDRIPDREPGQTQTDPQSQDADREGIPQAEGKATFTDKVLGKAEKVTGSLTNDPEKRQRGELRETGGKAAAASEAPAPDDRA